MSEQGPPLTLERAQQIMKLSPWLITHLGTRCTCNGCSLCAFRFLALTDLDLLRGGRSITDKVADDDE